MEVIRNQRAARVTALMKEKALNGILVSNCALGNLNTWLLASEGMPLHLPYNRNNLCLVLPDGSVSQFCACLLYTSGVTGGTTVPRFCTGSTLFPLP